MPLPGHLFISPDGGLYDTRDADWNKNPPLRPNYMRPHREIDTVADLKASVRYGPFAWPGAYEILYITADGACLCHECVRKEFRQIVEAIRTNDLRGGWAVGVTMTESETDAFVACDHCGRIICEGDQE